MRTVKYFPVNEWPETDRSTFHDAHEPSDIRRGKLTGIAETDCVAEVIRFELRNVAANYPVERSHRFPESSRILAAETVRV
jgi:hypothetical protein